MTIMCIAAANYLIERTNSYNNSQANYGNRISMTCKRLQKLLYFSDIEYMKRNNGQSMFNDEYHAWPSGPVIPSVYSRFMKYQDGQMKPIDEENHSPLTQTMKDSLEYILSNSWDMDTIDLIALSHTQGSPWSRFYNENDTKQEQNITKEEIYNYYQNNNIFG